jgi:hypothetical protein
MPKIKEKTKTIIIQDQEEITPNKTNLRGQPESREPEPPRGK